MIYLDHAAATPVSKKAVESMLPFFTDTFFNPSAAYLPAKNARESFESSKTKIANFIGAKSADLIITSGATEANSLAFTSINPEFGARTKSPKNQESKVSKTSPLVLVLSTEHASVLENAKVYPYDLISVDKNGSIEKALEAGDMNAVKSAITGILNTESGARLAKQLSELLK